MKSTKRISTKILVGLLLVTLLIGLLPISSIIAAQKITMSVQNVTGNRGEEVVVNINLSNNQGVEVLGGEISWDTSKLEYVSGSITQGIENVQFTNTSTDEFVAANNRFKFYLSILDTTKPAITYNGTIATIKFRIKDTATGTAAVNLNVKDVTLDGGEMSKDYIEQNGLIKINVPATGISLDRKSLELEKGKSQKLVATISPSDSTEKTVIWSSDNPNIATVDDEGIVMANAKGTTKITAKIGNSSASCNVTVTQPIEGISLNKTILNLERGKKEKLIATIHPENADGDKTIKWSSSDTSIAMVDNQGNVTAVGKGNAIITAKVGEKVATCNVTVGVALQSISLNKDKMILNKGKSETLAVTYTPWDTDANKTVEWTSSDTSVVTVDNQGNVTAIGKGNAIITARVGDKVDTCNVQVVIPLDSISIKSATQIQYGQTEKLKVTYNPEDTTDDKTVIWISSNEKVATVSTDGTVNAVGVGNATITARAGEKIASCEITVLPIPLNSISIKEQNITLNKGNSKDLTIIYNPENTSEDKTVEWTSDNKEIVSVENGKITAKAAGTAKITAKVGDKTATTLVTVKVPLEGISLNKDELTINKGEKVNLDIIYHPIDTTIEKKEEWSSSDTSVVTVNEYGLITAVGRGTAYVKAVVAGREVTCKVTVNVPLTGIDLKEKTELIKGQTEKLTIKFMPDDTTEIPTISWMSKNAEVAVVSADGVVTAKKEGTAEIVATVGDFEKICVVTVKEIKIDSIEINMPDFELGLGRSQTLGVLYNPENTTDDKLITWSSSDNDIVSIDATGLVIAKGYGTATITAKVGDKMATVDITVVGIPVQDIVLNVENSQVNIGETVKLNIQINPTDATNVKDLHITSSNKDVVFIDEQGNIIAKSAGKAIITVEANNGVKEQIEIEVLEPSIGDKEQESDKNTEIDSSKEISKENKLENKSNSPHTGDIKVEGLTILMTFSAIGIVYLIRKKR